MPALRAPMSWVVALVATLATLAPGWGQAAEPRSVEALVVGEPAPQFSLRDVNQARTGTKTFATARLVGASPDAPRRALVLSFAASYCEPCKKELAELGALKPRLDAAGVALAVVIVDTDPKGAQQMQTLAVETLALPYPVVVDGLGIVARRYRATSLPYTVVVGPAGEVRWVHAGFEPGALGRLASQLGL